MKLIPKQVWSLLIALTMLFTMMPVTNVHAVTGLDTEIITNGSAEPGNISGWNDDTGVGRWGTSSIYSTWANPADGNKFFFLFNPSMDAPLSGTMSQEISLSGTEGSGLFSDISNGKISMQFSISMFQGISENNEAKVSLEEYSSDGSLLKTSQVVNTTSGGTSMGSYKINTQVNPGTRKFKVILSATLTKGGYAQFDKVSLKLVNASTKSAPVFGNNFPTSVETDAGVPYTTNFSISDADSGDIDKLTFSAASTNINLVSASNINVTGSGSNRTLKIVPSGNLSGEADVTVVASDGVKSTEKTFHLIVHKVISMDTNLVENGDGTSGLAGWSGNTVNIKASGTGFTTNDPNSSMSQNIDISKFSPFINGGKTEFLMSSVFPSGCGKVSAQFYTDIACTNPVGNSFEVKSDSASIQKNIPVDSKGVKVTFINTSGNYNNIQVKNINFKIVNNFPKISKIENQAIRLSSQTVPVYVCYTGQNATLTATSSDQNVVSDASINVTGSGFNRNITFTPKKGGDVTITLTLKDGSKSVSSSFAVTSYENAKVISVVSPKTGFYDEGKNLDFTVKFNTAITGGTQSKLPLKIGENSVTASYLSSTADSITYRYTVSDTDSGKLLIGSAIDDTNSAITNKVGADAAIGIDTSETGVTVLKCPKVTSTAIEGTATYGTKITLKATMDSPEYLSGSIQFKANGINIGQPVLISGNTASYEVLLFAGGTSITAEFIPDGNNFYFASISSDNYSVTINRRKVVVTPNEATKIFGTSDPLLEYQITSGGLVGTDSLAGSLSRTEGEDVGEYEITQGTIKNENNQNYDITFATGIKFKVTAVQIVSATIDSNNLSFDKKIKSQADVQTQITWGSATSITDVKAGGVSIGADNYSIIGNTLIIKKDYLALQDIGKLELTVLFDKGDSATLNIDISLIKVKPVEKTAAEVAISGTNILTYGSKLNCLKLNTSEVVFVENGETTIIPGTLAWSTPDMVLAVGTTKAVWRFIPDDNISYLEATGELDIEVVKATPNVTPPTVELVNYSPLQKLFDIALSGADASWTVGDISQTVTGSWSFKTADTVPVVNNSGYVAVFTPTDTNNYSSVERIVTVGVAMVEPYIVELPVATTITYGQTLLDSILTAGRVQLSSSDDTKVDGIFSWKNSSVKPVALTDSNTTEYEVIFTPTDIVNYKTTSTKIKLTVEKALNAPDKPSNEDIWTVPYSCANVKDVVLPTGWVWSTKDADKSLVEGTEVTAIAVYNGIDKGNYKNESVSITLKRSKCTHGTTEIKNAVSANCTIDGYTGDTYCTICGKMISKGTSIKASGHNYISKITKQPTTTEEGVMTYTCTRCIESYTRSIAKLPIEPTKSSIKGEIVELPAATTITYGQTLLDSILTGGRVQFSSSDNTKVDGTFSWKNSSVKPVALTDSNITEYEVIFTPTDAVKYETISTNIKLTVEKALNAPDKPANEDIWTLPYSCANLKDVVLPTGWGWSTKDADKPLVAGTEVTEVAVYNGIDKGNYKNESVSIVLKRSKCTHGTTEIKNAVVANCTTDGYTGDTYCTICGEIISSGTSIKALGHNYISEITKQSTTTEEGVMTYTCTRCGESYTMPIAKLPIEGTETKGTETKGTETKETQTTEAGENNDIWQVICKLSLAGLIMSSSMVSVIRKKRKLNNAN